MSTVDERTTEPDGQVELAIDGMTCASCANRVERKLNKLDGVTATVNYATEKAHVTVPDGFDPQQLLDTIDAAGYSATLPPPPQTEVDSAEAGDGSSSSSPAETAADRELEALRNRVIGSVVLSVPVILISMFPVLQFTNWQWLALTLTAPAGTRVTAVPLDGPGYRGAVAADGIEGGERTRPRFPTDAPFRDLLDAVIAARFDAIPDVFHRPNDALCDWLSECVTERGIRGLLCVSYTWCDLWRVEQRHLAAAVELPALFLELDGETCLSVRTLTRIEAFLESIS